MTWNFSDWDVNSSSGAIRHHCAGGTVTEMPALARECTECDAPAMPEARLASGVAATQSLLV